MLKFIRGKGQQPSTERQKLQKELFAFRRTAQHGFPHKPSAVAYDSKSKLMAIGTNSGVIKVFGRPGVEFYGQHTSPSNNPADLIVQMLEWIPGTGRLLSLTASNQLVLWEPAGTLLVAIKNLAFDGKLKKISSLCCSYMKDTVWIGTEGGNVYQFDVRNFSVKESVIYHDVVLEQLPTSYRLNPGAIESVKQLPNNHNLLLIAYNRGLAVLWDLESASVKQSFISPGHGQSVGLFIAQDATQFTWYHADGSYATWDLDSPIPPENQKYVPYGPDPCKAIDRLIRGHRGRCELVVFSGGMPRSAYGEHQCVSVHCKDGTKVAFDFTSKVIDFFVTFNDVRPEQAEVLVVLLEEELVAYDLTDETLPQINAPYLHSLHASAVTCNHLVSQVSPDVYAKIRLAGELQMAEYSCKVWPITGGILPNEPVEDDEQPMERDVLITGHEDGSVKFWDCSDVCLTPLLHVKTAPLFNNSDDFESNLNASTEQLDDGEPPFRKAGQFDPYSDDPRLAVKKVQLCPHTGTLVIAGTAGNVVMANFEASPHDAGADDTQTNGPLKVTTMNLVSDRDGFVWKGHDQLKVKRTLLEENVPIIEGVNFMGVLQVLPPAAITCIAMQSKWSLVAAGTAHGLVLFDYNNQSPVLHKCTLNPNDLTGAGETLSRRKSFKKTLRESFRRLRKGRSTRNNPNAAGGGGQHPQSAAETRPVERQIEARPVDDGMGSMVRCLTFALTFITNQNVYIPTLWAGTNSSCVSVFVLNLPPKPPATAAAASGENGTDEPVQSAAAVQGPPVTGKLAKEIQMKHRAPIIGIAVVDSNGVPLEFQNVPGPAPHRVLIASEEQFKIFSLPQLKPVNKYKLTAHEGARVRRIAFATFMCTVPTSALVHASPPKSMPKPVTSPQAAEQPSADNKTPVANESNVGSDVTNHYEISLLCLTNLGDCLVLTVPELRRQLNSAAVRREDINGISSLCFTNHGEALYMMSSSEVQRISLSATKVVAPDGMLDVEDWSTPIDNAGSTTEEGIEQEQQAQENPQGETSSVQEDENAAGSVGAAAAAAKSDQSSSREKVTGSATALTNGTSNPRLSNGLASGDEASPNKANETITSSIGDITIDSVRDHLNSTTTTLCSTTTEEIVGRLSVLSTHTSQSSSTAKNSEILSLNSSNITNLKGIGDTTEKTSNSAIIKSIITTVKHGSNATTNGETKESNRTSTITTTTATSTSVNGNDSVPPPLPTTAPPLITVLRKESQF